MLGEKGFGIFAGTNALEDLYECALHEMSPMGVTYRVRCDQCGNQQDITIGWQQIVDVAHIQRTNRLPVDPETRQPWILDKGRLYPNIGCIISSCRRPIHIAFTPDEAARVIQQGMSGGYIQSR
jgi:hypothetical protein